MAVYLGTKRVKFNLDYVLYKPATYVELLVSNDSFALADSSGVLLAPKAVVEVAVLKNSDSEILFDSKGRQLFVQSD